MINLKQLFESGCSSTKKDKVCRSRGGESCAFDGAMIVLQPIKDTIHIVHGPIGCLSNYFNSRGSLSDTDERINLAGIVTDMNEMDIIYGAEDKLFETIIEAFNKYNPKAIFVYLTCISGLIGEDLNRVCKKASSIINVPVIPVDSPGFVGPKNLGNRIAGDVLIKYVIGTKKPPYTTPYDINLIGEYNIAGDLFLVEPLFEEVGIRVLSRITGNSKFEEICWANHAKLNVMICSRALINVAREMERRYNIPYIEVSFFGKTEFSKALRLIAYKLEGKIGGELGKKVEDVIEREEKGLEETLKKYPILKGKRAFLYTGGVKSWSFVSALKDLGVEIVGVGTKKSTYEDEEKILKILGDKELLVENVSPASILKLIKENKVDLLVAGGRNLYLAVKENIPFVDVNQERHTAYAGYEGLVNLARDLSESFKFYNKKGKEKKVSKKEIFISKGRQINPVKNSPLLGAILLSQGLKDAIPLIHGAQGCNFLPKVLLTKHFREPIILQNTGVFTEAVVLGGHDELLKKIDEIIEKQKPSIIAVLKSGLVDVKGEDLKSIIEEKQRKYKSKLIFLVDLYDYEGGMEKGYLKALESLLFSLELEKRKSSKKILNIFCGPHLKPADHFELHNLCSEFGIIANLIPDFSCLTGAYKKYPSLTYSKTSLQNLKRIGSAVNNIIVGDTLRELGSFISEKTKLETHYFKCLSGMDEFGRFLKLLSKISGRTIPEKYRVERDILKDTIKDAHFYVRGKRFISALQVDETLQISKILEDLNVTLDTSIVPEEFECIRNINCKELVIGDLSFIVKRSDLLISNSHAIDISKKLKIPLYQFGFPLFKVFGTTNLVTIGYRGSIRVISDIVNILMEEHK